MIAARDAFPHHGRSPYLAFAESVIGLYKTELIRPRRPSKGLDDLKIATAEWIQASLHVGRCKNLEILVLS